MGHRFPWRGAGEALALALALLFVFSVQFIPHLDTFRGQPTDDAPALVEPEGLWRLGWSWKQYLGGEHDGHPYALHVDEHVHWTWITQTQRWDRVQTGAPYSGQPPEQNVLNSLRGTVHEKGFHLALAEAQELTGISWYHVFKFLPAAWMAFTAFAVYALMRPHPGAIPAAALVALIPTTVRFMGPAFLVPIGFVLAWLPIVAILSEPARRRWASAVLLLLVVAWAFFIHLIGGFAAVALLAAGALLGAGEDRLAAVILTLVALLPMAWLYRAFNAGVEKEVAREEALPIDFTIFDGFGLLVLALWGLGLLLLSMDPPKRHKGPINATAGLSAIALGLIIGGLVFDLGRYATYARWHPPFFLAAVVPAGYAIAQIGLWAKRGVSTLVDRGSRRWPTLTRARPLTPVAGVALALLVTGAAVATPVGYHLKEPYYQVMDDETWAAYVSIDRSVGPPYDVYLSEPWGAPFLAALTGKTPHAVMLPGAPPRNGEDYLAYLQGQRDLAFYIQNDITLVVGPREPPGGVWTEYRDNVWLLDEGAAQEIARVRAAERGR